jgi:uncharacterized coiled-coil protein SlyX
MFTGFEALTKRLDIQAETLARHEELLMELSETLHEHSAGLDRIERKLDGTITRADDHSVRLERLEKTREQ